MSTYPRKKDRKPTGEDTGLSLCILASGSKGNAIYISNGNTAILVDAGLSGVEVERRLNSRNLTARSLDAVIVSHEHSDHIMGVGVLSRRYDLPVYISSRTAEACDRLGRLYKFREITCGQTFNINHIRIHPFSISHDAADPAGFTVESAGAKLGIATDLGIVTGMVKEHLKNCHALVLEANHDPQMLNDGPYPWPLKQRIQSRTGHLSNLNTRDLLANLQHDRLQQVILAHLSEENNRPRLALNTIEPVIAGSRTRIEVAHQDQASRIYSINGTNRGY